MALPLKSKSILSERLYTAEEFEDMPEFDEHYELIEGRLVEKFVPGFEHSLIARFIFKEYIKFDPEEKFGVMVTESNTNIGPKDTPLPDVSFWMAEHRPKRTSGAAPRPDMVVEILSPRDLASKKRREEVQTKIRRYQASGVRLIWVVNPKNKQIEVYQPGQLEPTQILTVADKIDAQDVIPGFKLEVSKIFSE